MAGLYNTKCLSPAQLATLPGDARASSASRIRLAAGALMASEPRNPSAIARIPGIDAVLIGPYDLPANMGHPGDLAHPDIVAAIGGQLLMSGK